MNMKRAIRAIMAVAVVWVCAGCASTYQARKTVPSGFLGDYSQLKKGVGDEAQLIYVNPKTDFTKYNKLLMDPVKLYVSKKNSKLDKLSKEDQQRIVDFIYAAGRAQLTSRWIIVEQPGPGVMRLRVAVTDATGANVVRDTVSSILPIGIAISGLKYLATGANTAVGSAGVECEGVDSVTGERLFAAVDSRVGRKVTGKFDKLEKYRTVEDAFAYWAQKLSQRLNAEVSKGRAANNADSSKR